MVIFDVIRVRSLAQAPCGPDNPFPLQQRGMRLRTTPLGTQPARCNLPSSNRLMRALKQWSAPGVISATGCPWARLSHPRTTRQR